MAKWWKKTVSKVSSAVKKTVSTVKSVAKTTAKKVYTAYSTSKVATKVNKAVSTAKAIAKTVVSTAKKAATAVKTAAKAVVQTAKTIYTSVKNQVNTIKASVVEKVNQVIDNAKENYEQSQLKKIVDDTVDFVEDKKQKAKDKINDLSKTIKKTIDEVKDEYNEIRAEIEEEIEEFKEDPKAYIDEAVDNAKEYFEESGFGKNIFGDPDFEIDSEVEAEDEPSLWQKALDWGEDAFGSLVGAVTKDKDSESEDVTKGERRIRRKRQVNRNNSFNDYIGSKAGMPSDIYNALFEKPDGMPTSVWYSMSVSEKMGMRGFIENSSGNSVYNRTYINQTQPFGDGDWFPSIYLDPYGGSYNKYGEISDLIREGEYTTLAEKYRDKEAQAERIKEVKQKYPGFDFYKIGEEYNIMDYSDRDIEIIIRAREDYGKDTQTINLINQVLTNPASEELTGEELMLQIGKQFTGKVEYGVTDNLETNIDCSDFVQQLYYIALGKKLGYDRGKNVISDYAENMVVGLKQFGLSGADESGGIYNEVESRADFDNALNNNEIKQGDLIFLDVKEGGKNPDHVLMFDGIYSVEGESLSLVPLVAIPDEVGEQMELVQLPYELKSIQSSHANGGVVEINLKDNLYDHVVGYTSGLPDAEFIE